MAAYSKKVLKDGTIRYAIQLCIKNTLTGKNSFPNITWANPDRLTGVRAEKAAIAFGEAWEKEYRSGKPKESLSTVRFAEIADEWLKVREHKMSAAYRYRAEDTIKRLNIYFGNKIFTEINARDVQGFFVKLNNHTYETVSAKMKDSAKAKFDEVAMAYGLRKLSREGVLARPSLYYARNGEIIQWETAKRLCNKLGLETSQYFEKIHKAKKYKYETIKKYQRILSCIFTHGIKVELIKINYASSYYLKDVIGGEESKAIDVLSEQEMSNLLEVLETENIMQSIPIYLMAMLGLRSSEVCGLEWKDIDFEKGIISINRSRAYIPHIGSVVNDNAKTKHSKRSLPICEALFEKLKECKANYDMLRKDDTEFSDCGVIFCNIDRTPANPHSLNKLLSKFLAKSGCRQISCHKLRHTFITRLISSGLPVNIVSKLAGHADCEITLKIYTHYYKDVDYSKDVLEKIFAVANRAAANC